MSKIDELLKKYCPNGVQFITFEEVCNYEQPGKYIVESTNYSDDYTTPVLTAGQTFILGYTDETEGIYQASKSNPVIIFDDFTGAFKWVDFPFKVKSSAMKLLTPNGKALLRYIFHYMGCLNFSSDEHKRLWIATYSKFKIPVPPLEVQREIVQVLDSFTMLTAELSAELSARKKQYEYYRDQLLSFNNVRGGLTFANPESVRWMTLGEICKNICSGGTPLKGNSEFYENGTIPWLRTQEVVFNEITKTECFITEAAVKKTSAKWIPANCVIVAISGASAGRCAINKIPLTTNQHCLNMEINSNVAHYKYVFYCVQNQYNELLDKKEGARGDLNASRIKSLKIPVPPIEIQNRIVKVLDNFDSICSDLQIGLPAEIDARKKQYEYYRDLLLSFEPIGTVLAKQASKQ